LNFFQEGFKAHRKGSDWFEIQVGGGFTLAPAAGPLVIKLAGHVVCAHA
jgi:hypothetical protein